MFFCKTTNGAPPGGAPLVTWIHPLPRPTPRPTHPDPSPPSHIAAAATHTPPRPSHSSRRRPPPSHLLHSHLRRLPTLPPLSPTTLSLSRDTSPPPQVPSDSGVLQRLPPPRSTVPSSPRSVGSSPLQDSLLPASNAQPQPLD